MKEKLTDVHGKKTPDFIILRLHRKLLKHIPDKFYMDITIDDVRDAEKK